MIVLKATQEQYDLINGVRSDKETEVIFIQDINDDWITSLNCKFDPSYSKAFCDVLCVMEEIEYLPKPQEEDDI
mgnify:CR=1 FL=1